LHDFTSVYQDAIVTIFQMLEIFLGICEQKASIARYFHLKKYAPWIA
jgi:hypothetical protein